MLANEELFVPRLPAMLPQEYLSGVPHRSPSSFRDQYHASLKRNHKKVLDSTSLSKALMEVNQDPNNKNNVLLFYSDRSIPKDAQDIKNGSIDNWVVEHIWPISRGMQQRYPWAKIDLHHLRVIEPKIDKSRGEYDFAEGGERSTLCDCRRSVHTDRKGTWEPPNAIKGDIARILFYMDLRYEGTDADTPDLELVDFVTERNLPNLGELCTLLIWHQNDPPSKLERIRNYRIEQIQGNRNPFIDNPKMAERLWAPACER